LNEHFIRLSQSGSSELHTAISALWRKNFRTETAVKVGEFVDISAGLSPGKLLYYGGNAWATAVSGLGGNSTVSAEYVESCGSKSKNIIIELARITVYVPPQQKSV
jgi:hypothetical protein